jgi:hypothetical protein
MLKRFASFVLIFAAASFLVWLNQRRPTQDTDRKAGEAALQEVDDLRSEVDLMKKQLAIQKVLLNPVDRSARPSGPPSKPAESDGTTSGAGAKPREGRVPNEEETIAQLDHRFADEATDNNWRQRAESVAMSAVTGQLTPGSQVRRVECRSQMCRIETTHPTLVDYQKFFQNGLVSREHRPWNGGLSSWVIDQSPNQVVAVTYLAREGQSVPPPELIND